MTFLDYVINQTSSVAGMDLNPDQGSGWRISMISTVIEKIRGEERSMAMKNHLLMNLGS
jgi:hypothetical protein